MTAIAISVIDGNQACKSLTYNELETVLQDLISQFEQMAVNIGSNVAVMVPMSLEFVLVFHG